MANARHAQLVYDIRVISDRHTLKKQAKREMWSDQEFLLLIEMSVLGHSRSDMEKTFSRTTGKIFSKI